MKTELEAKWLNVDADAVRQRLKAVQAIAVFKETLMRRKNFDFPDKRLNKAGSWIRVRDEGQRATISFKQVMDPTHQGTNEIILAVNDFDLACEFLLNIGLQAYTMQESRREKWELGAAQISIDTWPWIPTFAVVEAGDDRVIQQAARQLGLPWDKALIGSVEKAYQQYYDVTEQQMFDCPSIVFGPPPVWLEAKRRQ